MSNSFGSLHIRQKLGKSRVLAKTGFSGVKPGFTFHCPSKPRFIHKPEKFPGFGGIGYIYIILYIKYNMVDLYLSTVPTWHSLVIGGQ